MALSAWRKLKSFDHKHKTAVMGFIRSIEKTLTKYAEIPAEIYDLCLAFYTFPEFFEMVREDCFEISEDKSTVTNIKKCNENNHTIYMYNWIQSTSNTITTWKFKINYHNINKPNIKFGITSSYLQGLIPEAPPTKRYVYRYGFPMGFPFYSMANSSDKGTILSYELNLPNATLSCKIDGIEDEMVYIAKEEKIEYIFAMQLPNKGDSVTLLEFSIA